MTEKQTEALEKLNRGIQDSRQEVQQRTMSLAQDYFGDSAEELKQQIKESRATLEGLPDQVPGGREEAFQVMFQELMDNYSSMEECINEAQKNVASLDTDQIRRQGEVEASDAARREAKELGVDITEIEGTGSEGRVIIDDVKNAAEAAGNGAAQQTQDAVGQAVGQASEAAKEVDATDAARREAEARGIDLSQVEGTGTDGRIIISDVTEIDGQAEGGADPAGQLRNQASDTAGQAAQGAQNAAGQATDQAGQVAGQATDQAGQAAQGVQDAVGGLTGGDGDGGGGPLGGVTDQVGRVAQGAQDTAGQAAGQATDQAGQVAGQAQDAAGGVADQAQETAGQATDQAQSATGQAAGGGGAEEPKITNAARRKAEEMGVDLSKVKGTGSGGLITIKDVAGS